MSSPSSAVAVQYVAEVQGMTTNLSCGIAIAALQLYDVLLTAGEEYQYIWRSPKSWLSRVLYVCNRYITLLYVILELGTIPPMSNTSCASLVTFTKVIVVLNLIGPAVFTTLRIYALSRRNRILGGVALVLSMTPFVINMSTAYQKPSTNLPAPLNCAWTDTASRILSIGLTIASRGSLILVDSLAAAVTWRQTRAIIQLRTGIMKRPSLEQVMWENGIVYFCILVSLNMVDMVFVVLSIAIAPGHTSSYILIFLDPISSILNSRFLLALHETNARLEGAADTSMSSLSLGTGSGDSDPRAHSPEIPGFLGIIGGSIRSFHDEDEDLQSLEFALPQEEDQSEPEGEIVESGRDGGNLA